MPRKFIIAKYGESQLELHIKKWKICFSVKTPNLWSSAFHKNPIKALLYALDIKSEEVIKLDNVLDELYKSISESKNH